MILFFMSFLSIRLEEVWEALRRASLSILSLVALKMVVLPVILYGLFLYVMPDYAVSALLLTAVSTGVVAPFMSNLVGGNSARVLVVTVITSILVPFSLPAVVELVLSQSVSFSFWDMLRVLALAIFVPIAAVQILRRFAPHLLDAANRRSYPVNLVMFACITLGVFSKYAEIFYSDPTLIVEAALVGIVLSVIYCCGGHPLLPRQAGGRPPGGRRHARAHKQRPHDRLLGPVLRAPGNHDGGHVPAALLRPCPASPVLRRPRRCGRVKIKETGER